MFFNRPKTLVIGMGLAGLEMTAFLFDRLHSIILIDKRQEPFTRAPRVILSPRYITFLFKFISNLESHGLKINFDNKDPILPIDIPELDKLKGSFNDELDYDFFSNVIKNKGIIALNLLQNYFIKKLRSKMFFMQVSLEHAEKEDYINKLKMIILQSNLSCIPGLLATFQAALKSKGLNSGPLVSLFTQYEQLYDQIHAMSFEPQDYVMVAIRNEYYKYKFSFILSNIQDLLDLLSDDYHDVFVATVNEYYQQLLTYSKTAILDYYNCEVSNIKIAERSAKLIDGNKNIIQLDNISNIINAEGAARKVLRSIPDIILHEIPLPTPRPQQKAFGIMRLKSKYSFPLLKPDERKIIAPLLEGSSCLNHENLSILQEAGWRENYLPVLYIQYLEDDNQFYIIGEMPNNFLEMSIRKQLLAAMQCYTTAVLKIEYPNLKTNVFDLSFSPKDCVIFKLNLNAVATNTKLANGCNFFSIGDCLLQANFLLGSGIENSVKDAFAVYSCFKVDGSFKDDLAYKHNIELRLQSFKKDTQNYAFFLFLREMPRVAVVYECLQNLVEYLHQSLGAVKANITWAFDAAKAKILVNERIPSRLTKPHTM